MRKCRRCEHYEVRIKCLACEQAADDRHKVVWPRIIKPTVKNVPLEELSDREKAMVVLNTLGEMSRYRIAIVFGVSHHTVTSVIARSFKKLRRKKEG